MKIKDSVQPQNVWRMVFCSLGMGDLRPVDGRQTAERKSFSRRRKRRPFPPSSAPQPFRRPFVASAGVSCFFDGR